MDNLEGKRRKAIGFVLIIFGLFLIYWAGFYFGNMGEANIGLGIVGLGSFLVMLTGAFLITDTWNLEDGEFRKALTISIISVYFFSLAFGNKILIDNMANVPNLGNATSLVVQTNILGGLFNNLWAVVLTIIGFYFAARIIEQKQG